MRGISFNTMPNQQGQQTNLSHTRPATPFPIPPGSCCVHSRSICMQFYEHLVQNIEFPTIFHTLQPAHWSTILREIVGNCVHMQYVAPIAHGCTRMHSAKEHKNIHQHPQKASHQRDHQPPPARGDRRGFLWKTRTSRTALSWIACELCGRTCQCCLFCSVINQDCICRLIMRGCCCATQAKGLEAP